jgi:hypothetical protein
MCSNPAFDKLIQFYRERDVVVKDIEKYLHIFEYEDPNGPYSGIGRYWFKPETPLKGQEVLQKAKQLVYYTWHWRDYIGKVALEKGMTREQTEKFIRRRVTRCWQLQVVHFLADEHKHAGLDRPHIGDDIGPQYDKPFMRMRDENAPGIYWDGENLKPTAEVAGDDELDKISISTPNTPDIYYSVYIVDKHGKTIGDAWDIAQKASECWVKAIHDLGYSI